MGNQLTNESILVQIAKAKTCEEKTIHSGFDQAAKDVIVKVHNELRNKVAMGNETHGAQPQAANMMKMVWSDELAEIAQRWTDQCIFGHDSNRNTCDGLYVGQMDTGVLARLRCLLTQP